MLHPSQSISAIPEQTAQVAQAAFPQGNIYLQIRDELGSLYDDQLFASLYGNRRQSAAPPWRLALVSIMQFMENLSDRQAAAAVRSRIDWKYALSLELTDSGFDFSVLSEFRSRLIAGGQETQLLNHLSEQCQSRGWLKARGKADLEEADREAKHYSEAPQGNLHVSCSTLFAHRHLLTRIPEFLTHYPRLSIQLALIDDLVDIVGDGIDVAIRIGELADSSLTSRRLVSDRRIVCAAPAYLDRYGTPTTPDDLANHNCLTLNAYKTTLN
jgi:transposase